MEDAIKKKDDELSNVLNDERSRAATAKSEKQEWDDARLDLENKLAEAQELNDSLQRELDRIRSEHASETRQLKEEMEEARQSSRSAASSRAANPELERENQQLRLALEEQEQVTEEVRREAQEFLREMRMISQQSGAAWEKQSEMEKTIEALENDVRVWQNRYARTKTQLRDMRGSSADFTIDHENAAKYVREKGFMEDNGLVKDIHVTNFQMAIDDLLQRARTDSPERVIDAMKAVVVSVRRITKDVDGSATQNGEGANQERQKLKSRVSSTANNLITASRNYASSAGISPVSLLDAAASHLVAAVVELLRAVKIRATPAGELEEDDDGTVTPVESSFFSPQSNGRTQVSSMTSAQDSLPPPPPFRGLGGPGSRASLDSSSYSPINSPRESYTKGSMTAARNGSLANGSESNYDGANNKALPATPNMNGNGNGNGRTEDLKIYLEDQTAVLVQTIQELVQLIRNDADIGQVTEEIRVITDVVGQVMAETETAVPNGGGEMVKRLGSCRQRLMEAGKRGVEIASSGGEGKGGREWRMWTQTLPPIAFEIARETKELVQGVDRMVADEGADDFA